MHAEAELLIPIGIESVVVDGGRLHLMLSNNAWWRAPYLATISGDTEDLDFNVRVDDLATLGRLSVNHWFKTANTRLAWEAFDRSTL